MKRTVVGLVSSILLLLVVLAVSLYLQPWKVSQAASPSIPRHISVLQLSGLVPTQGMTINDTISFSRNNVWIAGTYAPNNPPCVNHCYNISGPQLFLEHFDGSQWNAFTFPLAFADDTIEGMSASSATTFMWWALDKVIPHSQISLSIGMAGNGHQYLWLHHQTLF